MEMYEKIKEAIENMNESDLVILWNEYCYASNHTDDVIYMMDEFDEIMSGMSPWEVARTCYYSGKFCPAHDYFWFNGYGNAESSDFPCEHDSPIYISDIAEYIVDNGNALYNDELEEILAEYNGESDDEQ